jgi:hypothetical protein
MASNNKPMYKNLYRGKIEFDNVKEGSVYKIVEVNFSGRENMTKAYKGRIVTKQKKAPYKNTPGVVIEYLEGPHSGKTVVQTAYKLYFFPENHTWAHLSANRSTRKNRKANRKTRKNTK